MKNKILNTQQEALPKKMDWIVFGDANKMKTIYEYVNWIKLTHLLSYFFLKTLGTTLVHLPLL